MKRALDWVIYHHRMILWSIFIFPPMCLGIVWGLVVMLTYPLLFLGTLILFATMLAGLLGLAELAERMLYPNE